MRKAWQISRVDYPGMVTSGDHVSRRETSENLPPPNTFSTNKTIASNTGIATTRSISSPRGYAKAPLFLVPAAKAIFWDRFRFYTALHGFIPWVTTLMSNHYHTVGYLRIGEELGEMIRRLHGSAAWMVMKESGVRHVPFWRERGNRDYFDACIRDVLQAQRAYRYTLMQSARARLVADWRHYPDTIVNVEIERAIRRAVELGAFLDPLPYRRYERNKEGRHRK